MNETQLTVTVEGKHAKVTHTVTNPDYMEDIDSLLKGVKASIEWLAAYESPDA